MTPVRLLPPAPRGILRLRGTDRARFLHGLTTQEVKKLPPGRGAAALSVSQKGRVQAMLALLADPDALWVETDPERAGFLKAAWEKLVISDDVAIEDR